MRTALTGLLTFLLASASIYTGIGLFSDPTGELIGFDRFAIPSWHPDSFIIEGIVVLLVFGVTSLTGLAQLLMGSSTALQVCGGIGALTIVWQAYQYFGLGIHEGARFAWMLIGLVLLVNGLLPQRREPRRGDAHRSGLDTTGSRP